MQIHVSSSSNQMHGVYYFMNANPCSFFKQSNNQMHGNYSFMHGNTCFLLNESNEWCLLFYAYVNTYWFLKERKHNNYHSCMKIHGLLQGKLT